MFVKYGTLFHTLDVTTSDTSCFELFVYFIINSDSEKNPADVFAIIMGIMMR